MFDIVPFKKGNEHAVRAAVHTKETLALLPQEETPVAVKSLPRSKKREAPAIRGAEKIKTPKPKPGKLMMEAEFQTLYGPSIFSPFDSGRCLSGQYGGRSERVIRHEIREVMPADCMSQYPTVNAIMGLQELMLARRVGINRDNPALRQWLEDTPADQLAKELFRPETWPRLRGYALIKPDGGDMLPFRTEYESHDAANLADTVWLSTNVGFNYINAAPAWYALPDVIESKILTGKCPRILRTIEFDPVGKQHTNVVNLFGDYVVDLEKDDLFVRLIEIRATYGGSQSLSSATMNPSRR
jgi:hypothetical protein